MKKRSLIFAIFVCFSVFAGELPTLVEVRADFTTKIFGQAQYAKPTPTPPETLFTQLMYQSGELNLPAYVTLDPKDGKKHPAIIWITGGESNSLGEFWQAGELENDQSAMQYREAGVVMMFPGLRGGNDNMGKIEYNLGEVDDIIASAKRLASLPYVDDTRIYLGGHSTGGTLALLTSEIASQTEPDLFKSVISFGATEITINHRFEDEIEGGVRAPIIWLSDIRTPTWLIEGEEGNSESLANLCDKAKTNKHVHCVRVKNYDHFGVLAPANSILAEQISSGKDLSLSSEMVNKFSFDN